MQTIPPIIVFAYNRVAELQQTMESLLQCAGIEKHQIIVFCDGPKNEADQQKTSQVRTYLKHLKKKQDITLVLANENKGLANSVISGVSQILETCDAVIVLEDDLRLAKNFLLFITQSLSFYKDDPNIFSVTGYTPQIKFPQDFQEDSYFCPRASSWGWATWKDRWGTVDWEVTTYSKFIKDWRTQYRFTKGGIDLPRMLRQQMNGEIDSWAIRWVYQQFLNNQATVYPTISKVESIGINKNATHTKKTTRFDTTLDLGEKRHFEFKKFNGYNPKIVKSFRKVFSIWNRLKDKIKHV